MAAGPGDLNYIIDKLEDYYAEVGGEDLKKREALKKDEFLALETKLRDKVKKSRRLQDDRNTESAQDKPELAKILRLNKAIKDQFKEIEGDLESMGKIIERAKKKKMDEVADKLVRDRMNIKKNYERLLDSLKEREREAEEDKLDKKVKKRIKHTDSIDLDVHDSDLDSGLLQDLDDEEKAALKRFEENDKKIDEELAKIIAGMDRIEKSLIAQEELIERNKKVQNEVETHATKVNQKFETQNARLKKILLQLRAPHKVCMDVALILIFLVMLGILYKVIAS